MKARTAGLNKGDASLAQDCTEFANRELTRNAKVAFGPFNEFKSKTYSESQNEPETQRAMKAWRACMRSMGFDYASPIEAGSDSQWWAKGDEKASAGEILVAKSDVKCKEKSRLVQHWFRAEKRLELESIRDHSEYFRKLKSANQRYLDNSRAVLARQ